MSSIKKNFIYNMVYQLLIIILPLITAPYVSRVLGAKGIGIYSYSYSIVYYFMMITMLGINNYGNRTIAQTRDDKKSVSKSFFEIYSIQLITGIIMLLAYLLYVVFIVNEYKLIALIQTIFIVSAIFDINWFFFGLEKFKLTVIRSTLLKILSLILIFLLVKTKNDVYIYALILSVSTLISQLLLLSFLKKEVVFTKIELKNVKSHVKPCLILFIPVIAISLYKIMDKIMLGMLTNVTEVGYYEQAEKIINIPTGLVTALGIVMLPRISNLVSKGDNKKVFDYMEKSIKFMMFLAFPICFGLIGISDKFIPIFMGDEFKKTSLLINYLAITLLFVSFANVIRKQWLVPKERDKTFTFSVILGAIVNLIINLLLIPRYKSTGACIGTIVAELSVMLYQIIAVHKELPILKYFKSCIRFFITSIIMFIIIFAIKFINVSDIIIVLIQILVGIIVYVLLNIKYINTLVDIKKILRRFVK